MRALLRSGVFWLLLSELSYAVMRVATRAGAAELPWAEIAAARFLGGSLIAIVAARTRGKSLRVADQKNAWLRSAFGTGGALALFHALGSQRISVGDATTLYATTPLWVALLSGPVLRERVGPVVWAGAVLGFAGVAVLLGAHLSWSGPVGGLVLLGAVSYALALLRLRRMGPHESSEAIALHMSLFAGVTMLVFALPGWKPVHPLAWLPLAASAISGGFGQVFVGRAYAREPAAKLSAFGYAGVVFTYLLEIALFHRAPSWNQVAGALMVVAAGVLVSFASRAGARDPTPRPPAIAE